MEIRKLTDDWAVQSYEDGCKIIELSRVYEERIIKRLKHYLYELRRFRYKNMDGNSVEDLPKDEAAEKYEGIRFTEVVNEIKGDDFSPAKYMAQITKLCDDKKLTDEMTVALLARGLRAFPSFLREIDIEEQLNNVLTRRKMNYKIIRNPEMDIVQHTDIMLRIEDRDYRIWLFQNSERGIYNTKQRLKGERGEIPNGIHILCPINPMRNSIQCEEVHGWSFYKKSYADDIVDFIESLVFEKIPVYSNSFINDMDLSKEKMWAFIKSN